MTLALLLAIASGDASFASVRTRVDPALVAALRGDASLRACRCIESASWNLESYPRVVVRAAEWRKLGPADRRRFAAAALRVAEVVYAREWGTTDFYEQVFIVDRRGTQLQTYQPQ
ncbi:MAG: hypothetical protein NVS2B8_01680 [Vulcanimicrobiaceae bacterium]